jgi:DNA-binding response OmpR family regulator
LGKYSNINGLYNSASDDQKHSIILVDDDIDVSSILAGHFSLAKYVVYKTISAEECLEKLKGLESKIDVVLVNGNIAADRGALLIVNIKKLNMKIKILALADNENNKTRVLGYGADELALKPISPTSLVEKATGLLMKEPVESVV